MTFYKSSLAYGVCANVDPASPLAMSILDELEPQMNECHMCGDVAVRVGIFETPNRTNDRKKASEFRALCERHKQFGMWSDADTAWGWE